MTKRFLTSLTSSGRQENSATLFDTICVLFSQILYGSSGEKRPSPARKSENFDVEKFLTRNNRNKYQFLGINFGEHWSDLSSKQSERKILLESSTKSGDDGQDLAQYWDDYDEDKNEGMTKIKKLCHVDGDGKAKMVDVGEKSVTNRLAQARAVIKLNDQILTLLMENKLNKGDALTVAQIAGISGAKMTSNLIPLCHNIQLSAVDVSFRVDTQHSEILIDSLVTCQAKTGAEMEALTAVTVAALTIYDMCKAVSNDITIRDVRLIRKKGGKSDYELIN